MNNITILQQSMFARMREERNRRIRLITAGTIVIGAALTAIYFAGVIGLHNSLINL